MSKQVIMIGIPYTVSFSQVLCHLIFGERIVGDLNLPLNHNLGISSPPTAPKHATLTVEDTERAIRAIGHNSHYLKILLIRKY